MSKFIFKITKSHYGSFALTFTMLSALSTFFIAKKLSCSPKASLTKASSNLAKNPTADPETTKKITDKDTVTKVVLKPIKGLFSKGGYEKINLFKLLDRIKKNNASVLKLLDEEFDSEKFKEKLQSAFASSQKNIHIFVAQEIIEKFFDSFKGEGSNVDLSRIKVYQCSQNPSELRALFEKKRLGID